LDLGEVSLQADGEVNGDGPLEPDALVTGIAFRKPSGRAVLTATFALASRAPSLACKAVAQLSASARDAVDLVLKRVGAHS
jgi:hypothetical protein